ncbi:MAG: acetyl-CoA acetyltransferase [Deltaproteobacteria bacterium]|nr:acetyl-CoA acetyltransferase [Deltaproteobacteria bacterium]
MLDRLPILVGAGQCTHHTDDLVDAHEPLALMEEAARAACVDAGRAALARRIDSVRVVNVLSGVGNDPAGALAARLELPAGERLYTALGGNAPQWLVNRTADDLAAGRVRLALLAGAEAMHTLRLAAMRGVGLTWMRGSSRATTIGDTRQGSHPDEWRHGAQVPAQIYPLFEIALRAHEGREPAAHSARIAALSASFAGVAATHPHAWFRDAKSAAEIMTITPQNRMVAFPYPKFMNAIMGVDQGAAVLMTTAAEARRMGIPESRWIYLHGGGDAHDLWYVRDRLDYHSSVGMRIAFEEALTQAGIDAAALGPVDLYSCFPVAAQFAARVLGFPSDGSRPLTVIGGLAYFGGPGNNYVMHAIATMVDRLRAAPASFGLVSGLGWYMTKHAVGIYGAAPPARPWERPACTLRQAEIDALPHPRCVAIAEGRARIETYTVLHDREGVAHEAIIVARFDNGTRVFANVDPDRDLFATLEREEMVGAPGVVRTAPDGRNRFHPLSG